MPQVTTAAPIMKVSAAALASVISVIVFYLLKQYAGIDLPADVAGAITTLLAFVVGYVVPIRAGEVVNVPTVTESLQDGE